MLASSLCEVCTNPRLKVEISIEGESMNAAGSRHKELIRSDERANFAPNLPNVDPEQQLAVSTESTRRSPARVNKKTLCSIPSALSTTV